MSAHQRLCCTDRCACTPSARHDSMATCAASATPTSHESSSTNRSFKRFLRLPLEIRLQIYRALIIPGNPGNGCNPWGCYFSAEPPLRFHPEILRVSQRISHEAKSVLHSDAKYPWKINVNSTTNKAMSGKVFDALDLLPCMMATVNLQFNFNFFAPVRGTEPSQTARETQSSIDYVCRTLSSVPIARSIGIFWWDAQENIDWEMKRICLHPLALFSRTCSFRLTSGGLQDRFYKNFKDDRKHCLAYLERILGQVVAFAPPAAPGQLRVGFPTHETRVCLLRC